MVPCVSHLPVHDHSSTRQNNKNRHNYFRFVTVSTSQLVGTYIARSQLHMYYHYAPNWWIFQEETMWPRMYDWKTSVREKLDYSTKITGAYLRFHGCWSISEVLHICLPTLGQSVYVFLPNFMAPVDSHSAVIDNFLLVLYVVFRQPKCHQIQCKKLPITTLRGWCYASTIAHKQHWILIWII